METFNFYFDDEFLGIIGYDKNKEEYMFKPVNKEAEFPPEFSTEPFSRKAKEVITSDIVREFIEDRIVPEDRQLLNRVLEGLELNYYDPWEVFVRTSGMMHHDYYWIDSYGMNNASQHVRRTNRLPIWGGKHRHNIDMVTDNFIGGRIFGYLKK